MASLAGAVIGKIGGNVYSINSGIQLVRAYQPNVANPSTDTQVSNRGRFKLCSQLAAAVAPVLAISKKGLVSGRNQFIQQTMKITSENSGTATVPLTSLQLTKSSLNLPPITATRGEGQQVSIKLGTSAVPLNVVKVVYAAYSVSANLEMLLYQSAVASTPGVDGKFEISMNLDPTTRYVVYAYGITESETGALAKYGNYSVDNATWLANLMSTSSAAASGLGTTVTRSLQLDATN